MTRPPTVRAEAAPLPWAPVTVVFGYVLPAAVLGALSGWFVVGPILDILLTTLLEG